MTREEFDALFVEYREFLREEVLRFRNYVSVYRQLQERKADHLAELNLAPAFFQTVGDSLFTAIVLWADKLFDERGERGLFNFLTFVEQNRKWLSMEKLQARRGYSAGHWMLRNRTPITHQSIATHREECRALAGLKSIRLRRDKFHGHFDKDYFFDRARLANEAPIAWADLDAAADVMGKIVNTYSNEFDGRSLSWHLTNIQDLDSLLRCAAAGSDA